MGHFRILCAIILLFILTGQVEAADRLRFGMGLRVGHTAIKDQESFRFYDLAVFHTLPWDWRWHEDWFLNTFWQVNFGVLDQSGQEGVLVGTGPSLTLDTPIRRVSLFGSARLCFLEKTHYGKEDLGGSIQFAEEIGVNLTVVNSIVLGYRLEHISNANLYRHNPGLDFHMLEIRFYLP